MKKLFFSAFVAAAVSAAAFEKIAFVDNFDFAHFFDVETREGEEQVIRHVLETGCDKIWWRVMSGAVPRYHSAEEKSPSTVPPFDLRRLPLSSEGGWIHFEKMGEDLFGIFRDLNAKYGIGFGAHWTTEEAHWCDWSVGAWNLENPQYWCRNEKLIPWPGKASLAFPEVVEHKLRLVDEILATGVDTIYIDTCRYSGWTPSREFVKPNIDKWRAKYGCEPPYEKANRDDRWIGIVADNEMNYLREIRKRLDRFTPKRKLVLGIEEAGRSEKDGGDFLWHERALDWRTLAEEGTVDALAVICARIDKSDPWNSARKVYDGIIADRANAKVYFPVRIYDFWGTSHGIPTFKKASGLDTLACGKKLLEMARDAGGDGIVMECVDFNNYPPELREAIRTFGADATARPGVSYATDGVEKTAVLSNRFARLELTLKGAQIRSLRFEGVKEDLLFCPSDMTFRETNDNRGGIPVCWPWFGCNGEEGSAAHGFARYSTFEIRETNLAGDLVSITLGLPPSEETKKIWPYECDLEYTVELGRTLNLTMRTKNVGDRDVLITEGLHPYWRVSDRRNTKVTGLDGTPYCFADLGTEANAKWQGPFIPDRHYDHVFWRGDRSVEIVDPGWKRVIRMGGRGYNKYVIWTPGAFKAGDFENLMPENAFDFVCVEPATLFKVDGYVLRPGEEHLLEVTVSCEAPPLPSGVIRATPTARRSKTCSRQGSSRNPTCRCPAD